MTWSQYILIVIFNDISNLNYQLMHSAEFTTLLSISFISLLHAGRLLMQSNALLANDDTIIEIDLNDAPSSSIDIPVSHCANLAYVTDAIKTTIKYGTAIGTTLSTAIYSFGFPSHIAPSQISWQWWHSLSKVTKLLSITNASVNFIVGVLVRLAYFPKIADALRSEFHEAMKSPAQFSKNALIMLLAVIAAIAGGALVYESFIASGPIAASINALGTMIITAGFRFVSLTALFKKIINLFDKDYQFQQLCIKHLRTISEYDGNELTAHLKNVELNEDTVRHFLVTFYDHQHNVKNKFPTTSSALNYVGKTTDILFGLSLGIPYFMFFTQKGLDGIKIILHHANPSASLNTLSTAVQLTIGGIIASSSGVLAFLSGYDFRTLILDLYETCKKHPLDIAKMLILIPATTISALSLTSAVEAMTSIPNVYHLTNDAYGTLFTVMLTLMAVCFDLKAIADGYILEHPEDELEIKHVATWLEHNKLSSDSIVTLKNHSFFAKPPQMLLESDQHDTLLSDAIVNTKEKGPVTV